MDIDLVESFLKNFMSTWQIASIYEIEHPLFRDSLNRTYNSLLSCLVYQEELIIGILEGELASGEHIFFELSKKMSFSLANLKEREIEKIVFQRGIAKEELVKFFSFLITPKEKVKDNPQKYMSAFGIRNIRVDKLKSLEASEEIEAEKKFNLIDNYHNCLDEIQRLIYELIDKDAVDSVSLKFTVNNIMQHLAGNHQIFLTLLKAERYDSITFVHLLNVSILSIYFSQKLGFDRIDCLDIGLAALFHDIGKLYIEKKILKKPERLDEEEFAEIKSHATLGSGLILKNIEDLSILAFVVALEHHLGYESGGYPKLIFPRKPHLASLIISICDVYDALSLRRYYKRDYLPELIYTLMMRDREKKFDPKLLDDFFKIMGVWPNGAIVCLEDKAVAIVRKQNEDDIFSPEVEIVSGGAKKAVDLSKDKTRKIKHSLNPFNEGKEYINLL